MTLGELIHAAWFNPHPRNYNGSLRSSFQPRKQARARPWLSATHARRSLIWCHVIVNETRRKLCAIVSPVGGGLVVGVRVNAWEVVVGFTLVKIPFGWYKLSKREGFHRGSISKSRSVRKRDRIYKLLLNGFNREDRN